MPPCTKDNGGGYMIPQQKSRQTLDTSSSAFYRSKTIYADNYILDGAIHDTKMEIDINHKNEKMIYLQKT